MLVASRKPTTYRHYISVGNGRVDSQVNAGWKQLMTVPLRHHAANKYADRQASYNAGEVHTLDILLLDSISERVARSFAEATVSSRTGSHHTDAGAENDNVEVLHQWKEARSVSLRRRIPTRTDA